MISKKYLILNKAKEDFEKRIEQGENIQFNFTCNSCKNKRRRLNHTTGDSDEEYYMEVSSSSDYSSTEEEEEDATTIVQPTKRVNTRVTPSATPSTTTTATTTRRSRSSFYNQGKKSNSTVTKNSNANAQTECCIIGCDNTVTNRLRFSLRCHKEDDFKSEFLDQGWNKVCHYHYFSDLYKFKKQNKANKNGGTATATTTSTKKKNNVTTQKKTTTQKRSREEFEAAVNTSPFEELTIIPAPAIMMETKQPLTPCKAVTPNTKIDASIFFSFVGGLANSSNITKAM